MKSTYTQRQEVRRSVRREQGMLESPPTLLSAHTGGKSAAANKTNTKGTGMSSRRKTFIVIPIYKYSRCPPTPRERTKLIHKGRPGPSPCARASHQESLGSPNSFTVPASRLLSYLPSLSSQANASRGLLGCQATVKVGDSHCTSHSLSPVSTSAMSIK